MRSLALVALVVLRGAIPCLADDTITIRRGPSGDRTIQVQGQIEDWTGREIRVRLKSGSIRPLPMRSVVDVSTTWTEPHALGNAALDQRDLAAAARHFAAAYRAEKRGWARRVISGQLVLCQRAQGRWREAAQLFIALAKSDPTTTAYDRIPLTWYRQEVIDAKQARAWMEENSVPAAQLLGASFLLGSPAQAEAAQRLRELRQHPEPHIAALATMQLWRLGVGRAAAHTLREWSRQLENMPEAVRAGGYYLLAEAHARLGQESQAALAYWRLPLLYPWHRDLAARALLEVGRQAFKAGHPKEARRAWREASTDYGDTLEGRTARDMLSKLPPSTARRQPTAPLSAIERKSP